MTARKPLKVVAERTRADDAEDFIEEAQTHATEDSIEKRLAALEEWKRQNFG